MDVQILAKCCFIPIILALFLNSSGTEIFNCIININRYFSYRDESKQKQYLDIELIAHNVIHILTNMLLMLSSIIVSICCALYMDTMVCIYANMLSITTHWFIISVYNNNH